MDLIEILLEQQFPEESVLTLVTSGNIMSKKKNKPEIPVINETRDFVLWRRVSTQEQGESGLGLDAQLTIAKMFLKKDPIKVFTDVYSGTKLKQCVGLWQAIDYCKQNNAVLVVAKVDRFRSVYEALDVLDCIGERNIIFCDCPSSDRFVLTVLFAMNERTAIIGRINTKIALAERKRQIKEQGGFMSKAGNYCTHLGSKKGVDLSVARRASAEKIMGDAADWRRKSALYVWVENQVLRGRTRKEILEEAEALYNDNPEQFCTREGKMLTKGTLSRWVAEITIRN